MPEDARRDDGIEPAETVYLVPIDSIDVDEEFNIRGPIDVDHPRFAEFVESVRERPGIESPIVVRPNPKVSGRFLVVHGNRRLTAVRFLRDAAKDDIDRRFYSVIIAVIRDYDDLSAFVANAVENIARENIPPYRIAQRAILIHERFKRPYRDLARTFGITPAHLALLVRMEKHLSPRLLRRFHGEHAGEETTTFAELAELSQHPSHEEQDARFEARIAERRALQRLAESQGLIRFGDAPIRQEDVAREKHRMVNHRKVQGALLSLRALEAFSIDGEEFAPTEREREIARAMLRWVLGIDRKTPLVIKIRKEGDAA